MYLLNTNVVSELRRVRPHGRGIAWLSNDEFIADALIGNAHGPTVVTHNVRDFDARGLELQPAPSGETMTGREQSRPGGGS